MKKYLLPTLTVLGVALGIFIGTALSQKANAQRIYYRNGQWQLEQSKVDRLLQLMESVYVDAIDVDSITDEVMTELVQKLDPHSAYIPKEDLEMVGHRRPVHYPARHCTYCCCYCRRSERGCRSTGRR